MIHTRKHAAIIYEVHSRTCQLAIDILQFNILAEPVVIFNWGVKILVLTSLVYLL